MSFHNVESSSSAQRAKPVIYVYSLHPNWIFSLSVNHTYYNGQTTCEERINESSSSIRPSYVLRFPCLGEGGETSEPEHMRRPSNTTNI